MKKCLTSVFSLFALLLITLFINISCKDHEVPEVLPVLKTLPIQQTSLYPPPNEGIHMTHYRLIVTEKGNVPVSHYGIVFTTYREAETEFPGTFNKLPTVSDITSPPHAFKSEFGLGEKKWDEGPSEFSLRTYVYQRAYAILADGRVIYGDVVWTVAGKITPIS